MEIIKDLPDVFEQFATQRQESFLKVKELKEQGVPVVGVYCTYFPEEIVMAMKAATVGLCSTSDETIPEAERDLPKNLCPLIKSSYGFAKTQKCPFFYFSDLVVGETTCDGKKKMYEYLAEYKPVYVMELPNRQSEDGLVLWKKEIIRFKEYLESFFNVTITEDDIREAIKINNKVRLANKRLYELMQNDPVPMSGMDLFNVLYGSTFRFDKASMADEVNALADKLMAEYNATEKQPDDRKRILVTGCPIGGVSKKVISAIESNGGVVVTFENCSGAKSIDKLVDESNPDVYEALAERYLAIGCSVMTPNPNRLELLGRLIDEYKIDGVVEIVLQACHTYNVETLGIRRYVNSEKNIPYISVETDYSQADAGQLTTRLTAFLEML